MTTAATILGAIPLALAVGAGAESRQQIGWVIVGGLVLGTFFTLFVVPAVYTLVAPRDVKLTEPKAVEDAHPAKPADSPA
jgi:multidrug efflux pump